MSGTLYVVATPIGNLDDLAPRARQTLGTVDRIAAEDTRHTGRLLTHIGVKTPQTALHEFNESAAAKGLVDALLAGENIALVSDAGTPLLSDPGFRLVRAAHDAGVRIVPIPGPSAVVAALSVAGLATDRFCFEGFLPAKSAGRRRRRLEALRDESRTLVFFEAVHRVAETLEEMAAVFGPAREATLARELTKLHEEVRRARLGELAAMARDGSLTIKGEFVIVVAGAVVDPAGSVDADTLLKELVAVLPGKQAAAIVARVTGESRNAVYQRMLELKERQ